MLHTFFSYISIDRFRIDAAGMEIYNGKIENYEKRNL